MSAEYSIEVEPQRNLVRIRMGGFFTLEDIEGFYEVRRIAHRELTCGRNEHLTINDIRDMKIQSQEIVDAFRELLADPAYRSRRLAFVVSPTLARTQVVRALANRQARIFEDFWSAESWLFGPAEEAEAA
ncbi:hypothetical protein OF829_07415 [Sphingomonas sp. LB-2]|uniref:hypothetical protein n=1 Tax=Sphingomonas caeni TaxID=2984949 RepID=UPI00222E4560|nr:hypothetical protein [Sphingomonas caeni]MCW3847064.1 hypothetical protein [Sphingomonas caeni]